jgi:uncharacterized protein with ATP-grasp and redox domains
MRTYLDCLPCLMSQALCAVRQATDDKEKIKKVLAEVGSMIKDIPVECPSPETARRV